MTIRERIAERCGAETIMLDDCDDAIIGVSTGLCCQDRVVYSYSKLVDVFVAQGMMHEEAVEWVEFNIVGMYVENGPVIMSDLEDE